MESYRINNLSFTYPGRSKPAIDNVCLSVERGEFITLCGRSGCGKTTLLRLLKPAVSPHGDRLGEIFFDDTDINEISAREQAEKIGFVLQDPDSQIVTDKVWHELVFGAESIGLDNLQMRIRAAETAAFFGIEDWFHKNVRELSGGQKQLLNLASVMILQPSVIILDEPTSRLDPISAQEFLGAVKKINSELGTTVIMSEHRLEDVVPLSDRVIVMENGKIIADSKPSKLCNALKDTDCAVYRAFPTPIRVYDSLGGADDCPVTVRDGRKWLADYAESNSAQTDVTKPAKHRSAKEIAVEVNDIWFRYGKNSPDIIKGLNAKIEKGSLFAVIGGNGVGKSTLVSVMSGIGKPYRGSVKINGRDISQISDLHSGVLGVVPQEPRLLFSHKNLYSDLVSVFSDNGKISDEQHNKIIEVMQLCGLTNLAEFHPCDLSGGEMQRAALAKVLLSESEIIILDEPTKGMDAEFKEEFAAIVESLKSGGKTVIMVSHDIEFCAEHADVCAMIFDGAVTSCLPAREFFDGNSFYTTAASRMSRGIIRGAVTADDIILACGGSVCTEKAVPKATADISKKDILSDNADSSVSGRHFGMRVGAGLLFFALLVVLCLAISTDKIKITLTADPVLNLLILQTSAILSAAAAFGCFLGEKSAEQNPVLRETPIKRTSDKKVLAAMTVVLLASAAEIYAGIRFFGDRKYYFISLLIIFETLIPIFVLFENRRPHARELVLISALCAAAVAGRTVFYAFPQFKPVAAMVIITGVCFGCEYGFLVGVGSAFLSNFLFGQGPWTPWQMFAFGLIGFLSGVLADVGIVKPKRVSLCVFGFAAVLLIYGIIMNTSYVFQSQSKINPQMLVAACASGLPFDLVHALSTVFFLWFISEPLIEKSERIKTKYGLFGHAGLESNMPKN